MLRAPAGPLLTAALLLAAAGPDAHGLQETVAASPDITLSLGGALVTDHQIVLDDLQGGGMVADLGALPAAAAVDALHLTAGGAIYFSLATVTELGGTTYRPADVISYDGVSYSLVLDAAAAGVPPGADLDALSLGPGGDLLVSFDVTVDLPGGPYADEDLALWDGSGFLLAFDGSVAGVPEALDLDAAHRLIDGRLLLSFDGAGTVAGIAFADEDLLEYAPATGLWSLAYDGSSSLSGWLAGDLEAATLGLEGSLVEIPTLGAGGLVLLAALLGLGGLLILARSRGALGGQA